MLGREFQQRARFGNALGRRNRTEGDVDGSGLLRDGVDVLLHGLLDQGIDLRGLGKSAAADDVRRDGFAKRRRFRL
jgi:hypothetical protein